MLLLLLRQATGDDDLGQDMQMVQTNLSMDRMKLSLLVLMMLIMMTIMMMIKAVMMVQPMSEGHTDSAEYLLP